MRRPLETAAGAGSRVVEVPPELLEPVAIEHRRHVLHDLAADLLDGWLRRLASQETRARRVLGKLCAELVRRKTYHPLGFARLSDYARERVGFSASEVRALAAVSDGLERFPNLAAAFDAGEISWSKARLLVGICAPETESSWIARARLLTVRALRAEVESATAPPSPAVRTALDDVSGEIAGEPSVRFRLRCPRWLVPMWRRTVELTRRTLGAEAPVWEAAEMIAAEGASALEPEEQPDELARMPSGEILSDDARTEAADRADLRDEAFPSLDWSAVAEALPEDVENLGAGIADLDAFRLDRRLREARRAIQRIDWQTGRLLHMFSSLRLHRVFGFRSFAAYVRERLGFSGRRARSLVSLDRKAFVALELIEAYRAGKLSPLRAHALLPVIEEANAAAWVARAREVTLRRLVREIEWAEEARDAAGGFATALPPPPDADLREWQMCARPDGREASRVDSEIVFVGPADIVGFFRGTVAAYAKPWEPLWRGLERLLDHVGVEWEGQPRHRDPVYERDGWCCSAPACSSRQNLHDHHMEFRSHGGGNELSNRSANCAWHHLRGIHGGLVRATGRAPDLIVWELGVGGPGGEPLAVLHGDRYLSGAPD